MLNTSLFPNDVNGVGTSCEGTSSGRCSLGEQRGPGRYPMTARMRWSKEVNKAVMECFYRSKPSDEEGRPIRGYRQRMFRQWRLRGMFECTEQRACDQARAIRKNGWLSELELEMIKRKIDDEAQNEDSGQENGSQIEIVNEETLISLDQDNYISNSNEEGQFSKLRNDIKDAEANEVEVDQDHRQIIQNLKEIMKEGKTTEGIMFKKVDKKMLRHATEKVNLAIKFIDTSKTAQTNDLIRAASVWVAEELGLKRIAWREKNQPKWKRRIQGDVKRLRQDFNLLERERKGELGKRRNRKLKYLEENIELRAKVSKL